MAVVYRAWDHDDRLLYVGCTEHFERRRKQHRYFAEWHKQVNRWSCEEYPNLQAARRAEAKAIRTEQPPYNIVHGSPARRRVSDPIDGQVKRSSGAATTTPYSGKRYTETEDYLIFVWRVLRGLSERVGSTDTEALKVMMALRDEFDDCIAEAVAGLRNDPVAPASWQDIGHALGTTRQSAMQRYGKVGGVRRPGGQPGCWR